MTVHPRDLLLAAATRLNGLRDRVVFVGGAMTQLLITDPGAAEARATLDVDVIVEVTSHAEYVGALRNELIALGFREDTREGAPLCRWLLDDLVLDVMPTHGAALGFTNRWYEAAAREAVRHALTPDVSIRIVTAPYFLATKMEAFAGRGAGDFLGSRDMEDIVALVDGRAELRDELARAREDVRVYVREILTRWLGEPRFLEAIAGHLPGDLVSQGRRDIVVARLRALVETVP